jgi:uncharacterized protein (TIGR00297 family)
MTGRDLLGLLISFLYPTVLLLVAELIRRRAGWAPEFTRKLVHIGAGMWVFGALALFDHWWAALIATTAFIAINWVSARRSLIPAMDAARGEGLGTVWFMVSFTVLLGWFWSAGRPYLAASAMMAMTWGDAAAAIVGRAWGRHRYHIGGQTRSLEGSGALALATFLSITPTLLLLAPDRFDLSRAADFAALAALVAVVLEPAAPHGQDNLSVPIGVGVVLWLLDTGRLDGWALAGGLALSAAIGLAAYAAGSLTAGGVLGAVLTGTATFAFGGLAWGVLLILFFGTSSALSRLGGRDSRKQQAARAFAKGGRRDLGQALANGGIAGALAVAAAAAPTGWQVPFFAAYVGSLAAVTADTWATELGVLSRRPPRLITTGQAVPSGTSGGVSMLGLGGAVLGMALIGLAAWGLAALWPAHGLTVAGAWLLVAALAGGFLGATIDSLLGATVQRVYWCPTCAKETERRIHTCGTPTVPLKGRSWVDNEVVNLVCAFTGAVGGLIAAVILAGVIPLRF